MPNTSQESVTEPDNWYVGDKDLAFFKYHGEGTGETQGAGPWEILMQKEVPNSLIYTAWRRVLQVRLSTAVALPVKTFALNFVGLFIRFFYLNRMARRSTSLLA